MCDEGGAYERARYESACLGLPVVEVEEGDAAEEEATARGNALPTLLVDPSCTVCKCTESETCLACLPAPLGTTPVD